MKFNLMKDMKTLVSLKFQPYKSWKTLPYFKNYKTYHTMININH